MFRAEEIQKRLREQPFRPLRIIASEGLRYDVRHPDLVFVGERDMMIGHPSSDNSTIYDQVTRLAYIHLVAIEDIPAASQTSSNGPTTP
jgi:hypothetical protein